jgi:4-hydroxy-3-polyprenylbenzoate decarboxylase
MDDVASNIKHRIDYDCLRDWLEEAERMGELLKVDGLSWEEDIGAFTDILQHDDSAPAVMFDNIPGYPPGYRVLCNTFGGKRKNSILGLPPELNKVELSEAFLVEYREFIDKRIPFEEVDDGPVMENVFTGDDVDLERFPTPIWHEGDGGRYIGTGCFNVTMDPEENWINLGTYRVMMHDKKTLGFYISPGKHGRIHRDKYLAAGERMPVCVVIGADPFTFLMSSNSLPRGVCEYDISGAYRGRPIKVIRNRDITGLPFPADAEIVLEGFVEPGNTRDEGPLGEWTGFFGSKVNNAPVIDVKAIYHRNDPILFSCPPQRPPGENSRVRAVMRSALLREEIAKAGVPDIKGVWCHEVGGTRMFIAVSLTTRYPGHAIQAGHVAAQCGSGAYAGKYVVVVDDDVDPANLEEVVWAMALRSDPATSINIIHGARSTPLDPSIPPWEKAKGNYTNSRAIIDACKPFHWKDEYPKINAPTPEAAQKALEKFGPLLKAHRSSK